MAFLYTINGISGTPRQAITDCIAEYFEQKGKKIVSIADPKGSHYGKLANAIIINHRIAVSPFTEALLYFTCSKEILDQIDWGSDPIVVSKGSFLEIFGYQNQLADWDLEDARKFFSLFAKQIRNIYPLLSIVLTEDYPVAEKRAGEKFEYKGERGKYAKDSNRFLSIKAHPIVQEIGGQLINVEVKSRNPQEVFHKEIEPFL